MALPPNLEAALAVGLDARRWEDMTFDLVKRKHPEAEQLRPPDGGADTIVALTETTSHVWQAKFHPVGSRIKWTDCEESLDRAVDEHGAVNVTFAFPRDLTKNERETFRRRLKQRHGNVAVDRGRMGDLRDELERHDDIRKRYLGEGPEDVVDVMRRTVAVSQPLLDGPDLLDRAFELAAFARASDPDFRYEVTEGEGDLAEASYPDSLFIKVEMQRGEDRVRLAALRRDGHEPPLPQWWFTDNEEGERAKREVRRQLARGNDIGLHGGYTFRVPRPPKRVKEIWDTLPEDFWTQGTGTISLSAGPPIPLEVTVRRGKKKTTRTFTLYSSLPEAGANAAYAGFDETGVAMIFLALHLPGPPTVEVTVSPLLDFGSNAEQNRDAVRFVREFIAATSITVRGPSFLPARGMRFDPRGRDLGDFPERLERMEQLFDDIVTLEQALGIELPVPEDGATAEDAAVSRASAELLRTRKGTGQFNEGTIDVTGEGWEGVAHQLANRALVSHPMTARLLGREIQLGLVQFRLPPVRVVPTESLVYLPDGQRLVHLKLIALESAIEFELVDAPPAAHPLLVLPEGLRLEAPLTRAGFGRHRRTLRRQRSSRRGRASYDSSRWPRPS